MELIQAIILGALQGIAEWLPISSQGQVMVAALNIFGIPAEKALGYAVFLHIGTLVAATAYFRKEVVEVLQFKDRPLLKFLFIALVGTAITAVPAYLLLRKAMESSFALMLLIGIALLFTGIIQFRKKIAKPRQNLGSGFLVGLAQGFSVIPGISRSGVTTAALLFQDFEPEQAFRLSFILSIPSVLLAEIAFSLFEPIEFHPNILLAIAVAAIAGYASIAALLKVAKKISFAWFCIGFGLLYIALAFI